MTPENNQQRIDLLREVVAELDAGIKWDHYQQLKLRPNSGYLVPVPRNEEQLVLPL